MAGSTRKVPVLSRRLVVGVVVLAMLLTVLGLVLAVRQARSLALGRIAPLRRVADERIADVLRDVSSVLNETLRQAGEEHRSASVAEVTAQWPAWVSEAFVWDGVQGDRLAPGTRAADESLQRLAIARLAIELRSDAAEIEGAPPGFLNDAVDGRPFVMAHKLVRRGDGSVVAVGAILDLKRLRRDLLEPRILAGGDLSLVTFPAARGEARRNGEIWSQSLAPSFPFWAVEPSGEFVARQRAAGLRQTLVYAGVTVLALVALLLAIRAIQRIAEHEITLSRMKSNFVADVSHELKTPLALIRLFGETLLENRVASPEKAREYYEIITRESTRLTHLINNILDFSRIDAGRKQYRMEPVDVGRVIRDTYESYGHELDHHGFEHECRIAEGLPEIVGDADAIGQVLLNLISNAIKYSTDDKHLRVEVVPEIRRGKHGVLILVRDRGIGIRPEDRPHLFDGFFRATDERVRKIRGAGLGLALCKHIVDAHGGYIDVESRLVKGSEFRVFLPENPRPADGKERT